MRPICPRLLMLAVGALGCINVPAVAQQFVIGQLQLVGSERVTRTEFNYIYRVEVTNTEALAANVSATVTSTSPATVVVEGSLTFGDIGAGQTVTSDDTFAIRHNRTQPFDASALHYEFRIGNRPPMANAGQDQSVDVGTTVQLDGSLSSDPDGDPLTFAWSFVSVPPGDSPMLSDPTAVKPTFVAAVNGTYVLRLFVTDDKGVASDPDTVVINTGNISCGQNVEGKIDAPGEQDQYRFLASTGNVVLIAASATLGQVGVVAAVFDPSGTEIDETAPNSTILLTLPSSGIYMILVRSASASASGQSYGLSLQFTQGQCGTSIFCSQTSQGILSLPAQHDPYRFTANSGDVVLIAASSALGQTGVIAELYDPTGAKVTQTEVNGTTGSVPLPMIGTYTILGGRRIIEMPEDRTTA